MELNIKMIQKNAWTIISFLLIGPMVVASQEKSALPNSTVLNSQKKASDSVTLNAPLNNKQTAMVSTEKKLPSPLTNKQAKTLTSSDKKDHFSKDDEPSKIENNNELSDIESQQESTVEKNATLGMLDRTQQEILLLQSQLELDKLKQQLRNLTPQPSQTTSLSSAVNRAPDLSFSEPLSKKSSKKILLIYQINQKKYARFQVSETYQLDLSEGERFPDETLVLSIKDTFVILKDKNNRTLRISIV